MPKRLISLCFIHDRLPFVQMCKSIAAAPYQKINIGEPATRQGQEKELAVISLMLILHVSYTIRQIGIENLSLWHLFPKVDNMQLI